MHKFSDAPGQPDGIKRGRWRRHGGVPFGQPFAYTDPADLSEVPWYKKLFRRRPIGWLVSEDPSPAAYIVEGQEIKVSPIESAVIIPVYGKDDITQFDQDE